MKGGMSGRTSISNSIGRAFPTRLEVRFEFDLAPMRTRFDACFEFQLDIRLGLNLTTFSTCMYVRTYVRTLKYWSYKLMAVRSTLTIQYAGTSFRDSN